MRRDSLPLRTHERIVLALTEENKALREANERLTDRLMILSGTHSPFVDQPFRAPLAVVPQEEPTIPSYNQVVE